MPNAHKIEEVAAIKDRFARASAVILADYRGLSVKEMQALRTSLRESGAELRVYKNTLAQIAMRELALPDLGELLDGPTAFLFSYSDPVAPAKALVEFAKNHATMALKGGFVDSAVTSADGIKALASLPTREVLIAKMLGAMLNPIVGFTRVLNGPVEAFARTVQAVADQKAAA
jgi:large subunit ribosomal protein L10